MVTHLDKPLKSSFLSCEKNTELILQKLFIENKQHSKTLKKLLVVNTKDCFDDKYSHLIQDMSLSELKDEGYIRLNPKLELKEHNEVMSYIVLSYDNFTPTNNPEFRDCIVNFDILCHTDYWDLNDYKIRPLQIAGYIDGILNNEKLVGIGTLEFAGCNELILSEHLSGYTLSYLATHGREDYIPENGVAPVYYG